MNRLTTALAALICLTAAQAQAQTNTSASSQPVQKWHECDADCRGARVKQVTPESCKPLMGPLDKGLVMKIQNFDELEAAVTKHCEILEARAKKDSEAAIGQLFAVPAAPKPKAEPVKKLVQTPVAQSSQEEPLLDQADAEVEDGPVQVALNQNGKHRGEPKCPQGMKMTPIGLCGITRTATPEIKDKYNVPAEKARCRLGTTKEFTIDTPNGKRVVRQTCRAGI